MPNGNAPATCVLGNTNATKIEANRKDLDQEIASRERIDDQLWSVVNQLRNHVPPWASILMTGLGIVLGAALTAALT